MNQLSHNTPLDTPTGRRTGYKRLCNLSKQAISTPANSNIAAILEEKRRRTLVLRNVPEAENDIPSCRQLADEALVASVLDTLDIQVRPIAIFRLGERTPDKPRFLMIELPTRSYLVAALRNGRLLKDSDYKHIFVGQSMTAEERRKWSLQRSKRHQPSSLASPPLPAQSPATPPLEEANPIQREVQDLTMDPATLPVEMRQLIPTLSVETQRAAYLLNKGRRVLESIPIDWVVMSLPIVVPTNRR
jgi:hypothetical protein